MLLTRRARRRKPHIVLRMAPMIDVVLLLLIFFLCSTSVDLPEGALATRLASSRSGEPELPPIQVRLVGRGDGTVAITCNAVPTADFDALGALLRRYRELGEPPVLIEGRNAPPYGAMIEAYDVCRQAGLDKVAFSAKGIR